MVLIGALSSEMQHIRRICHIAANPIFDIFTKTASNLGIKSDHVIFSQILESRFCPITHRHFDFILIHVKFLLFGEVQTPLPRIAEPI